MDKQSKNHNSWLYLYITSIIFSISATALALTFHDLWNTHPAIEAGALVVVFFSAFLLSYKLHQTLHKKQTNKQQTETAGQPTDQNEIDRLIDLSEQLKNGLEIEKQYNLINTIHTAALALKKEAETPNTQLVSQTKPSTHFSKSQSITDIKGKKLEETRIVFVTSDTSDRHQVIKHLAGWQIQVNVCSTAIRTFTEILSASDSNRPYDIVIVDQRQLDMEPIQFANSIYSEPSLQNLSLIYLGPENTPERDQQLASAGYSYILQNPIDKSLLYNALHATANTDHHHPAQNVTSFINHYQRDQLSLHPLDILIAANPANLKRIKSILKTTKHQVYAVENGEHALNALDSHHFDLAIFELEMPIMNGTEAIKLYRFTHQNDPWIPFILLAPETNTQLINECNDLDIDACLVGNIQHHSLLSTIKQAITEQDKEHQSAISHKNIIPEDFTASDNNLDNSTILGRTTLRSLEELGSGQEFVHNLINNFIYNSEELLRGMKKAIADNRYQVFIDHAFAFKDGAGNLGALAVYKASIRASHLEPGNFKDNASTHFDEIKISFDKTRKALLDYMAEQHNTMHSQ